MLDSHRRLLAAAIVTLAGLGALMHPRSPAAPVPAPGPPAPSLELVPADAAAFLHFRVAEVYDSPLGKQVRAAVAKVDPQVEAEVEKGVGVPLANIATLTMFAPHLQGPNQVVLITTRTPFNKDKVLQAYKSPGPEKNVAGLDMHRESEGGQLTFLGDRTMCRTENMPTDAAAQLIKRMRDGRGKAGPLQGALDRAAGKAVAVGLNVKALPLPPGFQLPPPFDGLTPLLKADVASFSLELGGPELTLAVRVDFPAAADAAEGEKAAKAGLKLLVDLVGKARSMPPPHEFDEKIVRQLLQDVQTALGKTQINRDQSAVTVQIVMPALATRGAEIAAGVAAGIQKARGAAAQAKSSNNLKQIVLAMHNYNSTYGKLPAHAIYSKDGKTPLLSWRVAILPYLEEDELYKQFHLDEPWDSEHNKKLVPRLPRVYLAPNAPAAKEPGRTYYQVLVGGGAPWERSAKQPGLPQTFADGTSNTIMIAEASDPVIWTKPDDITYDPTKPLPKLGLVADKPFLVAMADGSVRMVKRTLTEKTLRAAITAAGGEVLGPDWDEK
jgi:hypothetical protein